MATDCEPKICAEGWCGMSDYGGTENGADWCGCEPRECSLFKANCIRLGKEWPPRRWFWKKVPAC